MYVIYYALMLRCWQLVRILVKTNHPCLRVGHHNLKYYYSSIIECFGDEFLRRSTIVDTQCLLAKAEECGFPDMLESIDCMHC
jgi:hypothetical protein